MFCMNRNNVWGDDSLIAKMRVVLTIPVEKFLPFIIEIDREEIFDSWIFELSFLILFLPPIIAITHVLL